MPEETNKNSVSVSAYPVHSSRQLIIIVNQCFPFRFHRYWIILSQESWRLASWRLHILMFAL